MFYYFMHIGDAPFCRLTFYYIIGGDGIQRILAIRARHPRLVARLPRKGPVNGPAEKFALGYIRHIN
jgi:hypothetical protein